VDDLCCAEGAGLAAEGGGSGEDVWAARAGAPECSRRVRGGEWGGGVAVEVELVEEGVVAGAEINHRFL